MPDVFISPPGEENKVTTPPQQKVKHLVPTPEDEDRHALPGHTHNPLAPFCYYPDYVKFMVADSEEKVVLILRKHPITNMKWILGVALLLLIPPFLPVLVPAGLFPTEYVLVIALTWYLMLSGFVLERFLTWFFNVNIVTDERVFDVDYTTIFTRHISDANLDQIQDVTVEVGGALRTFFHFGNVVIQTAAEVPVINFEDVPNPDRVSKILRDLRVEEEREKLEGRVR